MSVGAVGRGLVEVLEEDEVDWEVELLLPLVLLLVSTGNTVVNTVVEAIVVSTLFPLLVVKTTTEDTEVEVTVLETGALDEFEGV